MVNNYPDTGFALGAYHQINQHLKNANPIANIDDVLDFDYNTWNFPVI